ncbi:uncharacterized protein LOC129595531 [Paramacrobiotus metropolitanus]|uniref:uncharacterized protein LOC129595531 n=1 Tax=Paramacrobiotus metropolitanus TaxID=2943436 RepID=UPI0024457A85|nr:uncharacterized protein LOC129595531 [Paramacrobiotus metropolitanus]
MLPIHTPLLIFLGVVHTTICDPIPGRPEGANILTAHLPFPERPVSILFPGSPINVVPVPNGPIGPGGVPATPPPITTGATVATNPPTVPTTLPATVPTTTLPLEVLGTTPFPGGVLPTVGAIPGGVGLPAGSGPTVPGVPVLVTPIPGLTSTTGRPGILG